MLAWLDENRVDRSRLEVIRRDDGERGARARADIREGEVVLRIPPRCMITSDLMRASSLGRAIARATAGGKVKLRTRPTTLGAYLAQERRDPRSPWRRYLDALPVDTEHLPARFGPRELALLRGSPAAAKVRAFRAAIEHDHAALRRTCRALRDLTLEEHTWGTLMAASRSFAADGDGQALIPLVDMINHDPDPDLSGGFDVNSGDYALVAVRNCAAGRELSVSYGPRCNSRLLLAYGFCLDENPCNTALLEFHDPRPRGGTRRFSPTATRRDADDLLSYLRRACATPGELALLAERRVGRGPVSPIGSRNERAALQALIAGARQALARYETTIEEDDRLLADPALSRAERTCLLLRRGEKRVLEAYRDMALATLPFLRLPAADFKRIAGAHAAVGTFSGGHLAALAWRAPTGALDLLR